MGRDQESNRALFLKLIPEIEKAVRTVAARKGLNRQERQELYSSIMLKIMEKDFAVLRAFQKRSRWSTYFTAVVQRVYLDRQTRRLGRWRPSAVARRLGSTAIELDRRLNRDGLKQEEAVERLIEDGAKEGRATLRRWAMRIPRRPGRRFVPLDRISAREQTSRAPAGDISIAELQRALTAAFHELSDHERRLLRLRFVRGWTVRRIAEKLGIKPRPLYRQFQGIFRLIRQKLERSGLEWRDIRTARIHTAFELDELSSPRKKTWATDRLSASGVYSAKASDHPPRAALEKQPAP